MQGKKIFTIMQFVFLYKFMKDIVRFYSMLDLFWILDYVVFQFYIFD